MTSSLTTEPHTGSSQASEEGRQQRPQSKAAAAPGTEGEAHNMENGKLGAMPVMFYYHFLQLGSPSATNERKRQRDRGTALWGHC